MSTTQVARAPDLSRQFPYDRPAVHAEFRYALLQFGCAGLRRQHAAAERRGGEMTDPQQRFEIGAEPRGGARPAEHFTDMIVAAATGDGLTLTGNEGREHHATVVAIAAQLGEIVVQRHVGQTAAEFGT